MRAPVGDPRLAGGIKRWHIHPVVHQQTVAEHSWNVARILLALWPEAPRELLVEALFNDTGEIATGDPPSTLKQRHPNLRDMYSKMEHDARVEMVLPWGLPGPHPIIGHESWALKMADMMEMLEYALGEMRLGNRNMCMITIRLKEWVFTEMDRVPVALEKWRRNMDDYIARRLREQEP